MSDVAIVGAGLIGLGIAYELAKRGASVRVFERDQPARAASWAGAGMLAPYSEGVEGVFDPAMLALCVASLERYPAFAREVGERGGVDPHLRLDGTVHAAFDERELDALVHVARELEEMEVAADLLTRAEVLALEPALAASVVGGLRIPAEGQVDNRRLGRALAAAASAAGVRIDAGCGEIALEADRRRVRGVRTRDGFVAANVVVNAAGAWAAEFPGVPPDLRVDVRPAKGQMLALAVPDAVAREIVWVPGAYLVPRRDGRLLVGATVEHRGFDTRVTGRGVGDLLAAVVRAAPALAEFALVETWAGLRPASVDGRPYLGATELDGYVVATGHFRNGILLAPITAAIVAGAIAGDPSPIDLTPFALAGRSVALPVGR